MCGIGGILKVHPPGAPVPPPHEAIPEAWLDILDEAIRHRGPDGQGRFRDRAVRPDGAVVDVALVHRRLAIIDPAGGAQPLVSIRARNASDGSAPERDVVAVVFNGCIYNHRELRRELEWAGHEFQTDHSDTEVIVHGFREWGEGAWARLDGMFAAAVWDRASGRLILARDRMGEKPLYAASVGDHRTRTFASTAAPLVRLARHAGGPCDRLSEHALATWLAYGYGEDPPFGGVDEVAPGSIVAECASAPGRWRCERYAELPSARRDEPSLDAARLEALLREAVRRRLEADVPLGCFLSGGVDSSLVAMLANEAAPGLRTFTVAMPDARYDESAYAAAVAHRLGTRHATLPCEPRPAEDLPRLIAQLGLPFGDSSLLPTHWISRAARREVAVALGGDGGDELFGGYDRYRAATWLSRWRGLLAVIPAHRLGRGEPRSRGARLARLASAARGDGYRELLRLFPSEEAASLGLPVDASGRLLERDRLGAPRAAPPQDPLHDDARAYLPLDLLRKTDTASMAVALEVRSPLLHPSLVAAALTEPLRSLMPRGQRKGLLRQVARRHLPAEIVDRPKMGFAIPIGEWFRTDYGGMKALLLDHLHSAEPFPKVPLEINRAFVRRMIDEHLGHRRDHAQRLYMLLVLSIWARWLARP